LYVCGVLNNTIMTNKTKFKAFTILSNVFLAFWLSETVFFLIRDGWHLKAASEEEAICDFISTGIAFSALGFLFSILIDVARSFSNARTYYVNVEGKVEEANS